MNLSMDGGDTFFRQHVLEDIEDKLERAIRTRNDYSVGFVTARIQDFAHCRVISRDEAKRYLARLEAVGLHPPPIREDPEHLRKIVINVHDIAGTYLELSDAAAERVALTKGIDVKDAKYDGVDRDDPALVAVVEEMGDAAGGYLNKLRVVQIPDYVKWEIRGGEGQPEFVGEVGRRWTA